MIHTHHGTRDKKEPLMVTQKLASHQRPQYRCKPYMVNVTLGKASEVDEHCKVSKAAGKGDHVGKSTARSHGPSYEEHWKSMGTKSNMPTEKQPLGRKRGSGFIQKASKKTLCWNST